MPKNNVSDPPTDQEIAFAHLVFSGTMTDRRAAEAVGLDPDSAAEIKSSPRVHAYMLEHRAAVQQHLVEQDTDLSRSAVEGQHRLNVIRGQVLGRLLEIAHLSPEMTRGSITGQVKALSMIVAIEGLIPDRRAASAQNKPAPPPVTAQIYQAEWLRKQRGENVDPESFVQEEAAPEPHSAPGSTEGAPPISCPTPEPALEPSEPDFFGAPLNPSPTPSWAPRVPMADNVAPDTRVPFSIKRSPFARRRR